MSVRWQVAIDASAGAASVALFRDVECVGAARLERTGSAEMLAPAIASLLQASGIEARELTDVLVGAGPGSFTGLRVAAALAKGLARGADATLHAVPSLPMIAAAREDAGAGRFLCVMDALRGDWFVQQATRHTDGQWSVDDEVQRLPADTVRAMARERGAELVGPPIEVAQQPDVRTALRVGSVVVPRDTWEPDYGRLAEAQVVWETANARPLPTT